MRLCDARILFVDDEPSLLEIFSLWLVGDDVHLISTAADGQEALELVDVNQYDLLITDVNMPRMNGITLVRRIAAMGRATPGIVFVSGFGDVNEREMYGLGVQAFLAKPLEREMLLSVVVRALAERSELWRTRMETTPRHSLSIDAVDFSMSAADGGIALGQGGFSAPYLSPVAHGKVSFECLVSASGFRFSGEGYVRWRSKTEGTIGVEFAYLEEGCRAAVVAEMGKWNSRAFIPSS